MGDGARGRGYSTGNGKHFLCRVKTLGSMLCEFFGNKPCDDYVCVLNSIPAVPQIIRFLVTLTVYQLLYT